MGFSSTLDYLPAVVMFASLRLTSPLYFSYRRCQVVSLNSFVPSCRDFRNCLYCHINSATDFIIPRYSICTKVYPTFSTNDGILTTSVLVLIIRFVDHFWSLTTERAGFQLLWVVVVVCHVYHYTMYIDYCKAKL